MTKSRTLRGGRLVGEGAFGCVYEPPIAPFAAKKGFVSKLLDARHADEEVKHGQLFKSADPKGLYGVYVSGPHEVDDLVASAGGRAELDKCSPKSGAGAALRKGKRVVQVLSRRARANMDTLLALSHRLPQDDRGTALVAQLYAFLNVAKGLAFFGKKGLYHHDVKTLNIVGFGVGSVDVPKVYKLIDFGMGKSLKDVKALARGPPWNGGAHEIMSAPYFAYPPLLTAYMQYKGNAWEYDVSLERFFDTQAAVAFLRATEQRVAKHVPGLHFTKEHAAVFAQAHGLSLESSGEKVRLALLKAVDTFSCGVILRQIATLYPVKGLESFANDVLTLKYVPEDVERGILTVIGWLAQADITARQFKDVTDADDVEPVQFERRASPRHSSPPRQRNPAAAAPRPRVAVERPHPARRDGAAGPDDDQYPFGRPRPVGGVRMGVARQDRQDRHDRSDRSDRQDRSDRSDRSAATLSDEDLLKGIETSAYDVRTGANDRDRSIQRLTKLAREFLDRVDPPQRILGRRTQ